MAERLSQGLSGAALTGGMPGNRGRLAAVLAAGLVAVAYFALIAAPASANVSHAFSTTFGSATSTPPDPYPISEPTDVAVDQASQDIYVTDPGHHRVEKFAENGDFLFMFGNEVNKTAVETAGRGSEEDVCPAPGHSGDQCQSGVSGESPGAFETPTYLAIDNYPFGEGDVYVGDTGDNLVSKFNSTGEIISDWGVDGQKDGSDDATFAQVWPDFRPCGRWRLRDTSRSESRHLSCEWNPLCWR